MVPGADGAFGFLADTPAVPEQRPHGGTSHGSVSVTVGLTPGCMGACNFLWKHRTNKAKIAESGPIKLVTLWGGGNLG